MERKKITEEEIFGKIDASFDNADKLRGEGLERVKLFHSVKNRALEKEYKRLSEKLGDGHPRVKMLSARITYNQGLFKDLDVEIERAMVKVPSFDKNSWMVHGRVLDMNRKGISGLTVSLYDERGNRVKEPGYGCTDKQGYFSIVYTPKERDKSEVTESMKLFLYVSDKNYRIVYKDSEPLSVRIGQIDYREISLSGEDVCSAPEPGKDDTITDDDTWILKGRVTDENGRGIGGLTIRPFDKELRFANQLGATVTDKDGYFMLSYKTENLRDLIEVRPDIYLNVLDKEGKALYTSKKAVRYEAGRIEEFDIKIKRMVQREK
ncbi:MAG: carboxypeptidase-like regulatory domain-containing protein [Candidatus Loosdrechtia sp.]|uniref:carboxypeptidase-like regulatory domain-containing protein n=1 Tax=Candidatus Loosdrechtia sp. TaxID=3101272 RepID=UPI003A6FB655|nr:MAG: carboxypeptidase-like regulatory domain-containing protein [Candidatus Jettenia sp. AMX2]